MGGAECSERGLHEVNHRLLPETELVLTADRAKLCFQALGNCEIARSLHPGTAQCHLAEHDSSPAHLKTITYVGLHEDKGGRARRRKVYFFTRRTIVISWQLAQFGHCIHEYLREL